MSVDEFKKNQVIENMTGWAVVVCSTKVKPFFASGSHGRAFFYKRSQAVKYKNELQSELKTRCRVARVVMCIEEVR